MGLPTSEPLGPGGPDLHYFLLGGQCLCPYVLAGQALQQKTTDQGGQNSQLQDIQESCREYLWNISGKVQGTVDYHGAEAKSCEGHCVNMPGIT